MGPNSYRFLRSVAALAVTLLILTACGGSPPASTPSAEPTESEDLSTFEPTTTPDVLPTTPAPVDSSEPLDLGADLLTTAQVTLSSGTYVGEFAEGSFTSTAPARWCGYLLPNHFVFGFPHDIGQGDIEDVTFGADGLFPGTSVSTFGISVAITAAAAGVHPLTSINPGETAGDTGSAQLSVANGTRTLVVDAADKGGVAIHLKAVCGPA